MDATTKQRLRELTATPAGMKWCEEHKKWEYPRTENIHVVVPESAPEYKAHIAAIIKLLPYNGGTATCVDCGNPADIVTDGLHTKFYCRHHWDSRCEEHDHADWMEHAQHDPLTEEEKKTFGIEEVL